jgi:hypothetical protein
MWFIIKLAVYGGGESISKANVKFFDLETQL